MTSGEKGELAAAKRRIAELQTEWRPVRRAVELVREVVPPRRLRAGTRRPWRWSNVPPASRRPMRCAAPTSMATGTKSM
jgi:hypothetical protein